MVIEDLHNLIDSQAHSLRSNHELSARMLEASKELETQEEQKKIQPELLALGFGISQGKLTPSFHNLDENGEEWWSDISKLSPDDLLQLKSRATTTNNPYLQIRYNIVLWNSTKEFKHEYHAQNAIDVLLCILNQPFTEGEEQKWLFDELSTAAQLSTEARGYKKAEIQQVAITWSKQAMTQSMQWKSELVSLVMDYDAIWKPASLAWCVPLLKSCMTQILDDSQILMVDRITALGIKLMQKTNGNQKWWYEQAGICYEHHDRMIDPTNFIKRNNFGRAMQYYRKAGNQAKFEQIRLKYEATKNELNMVEFVYHLPENLANLYGQTLMHQLKATRSGRSMGEILDYLATDTGVFNNDIAKPQKHLYDAFGVFKRIEFDRNLNTINADNDPIDVEEIVGFLQFFDFYTLNFFVALMLECITDGTLTEEELINWFHTSTWFGQTMLKPNGTHTPKAYSWMTSLSPAIEAFFHQRSKPQPNYIVAIDSLTLKIEGILRDITERTEGARTTVVKRETIQEATFEDLLAQLNGTLSPEDHLLIRAICTRQNGKGKNMRNNVAHCYIMGEEYSEYHFWVVLWVVMRLGKHEV